MAERKFDYNNVGTVYNQMKNINDNIKTLLTDTDNEVHNKVDVCEEAIYGDLGNQLLLSWDNISSNFPNFMDNFENWSALVAKASGDYSQFEADVAAFKNANPLGVTSAGATQGAVATSSYNNSLTAEEIAELDVATFFYEPTGATYIDTGMVEYAKQHKTMNIVGDVLNVVSIALSVVQVGSAVKAASSVVQAGAKTTALAVVSNSADDVAVATVANTADDAALAVVANSADDTALAVVSSTADDAAAAGAKTTAQAAASGIDDAAAAAATSASDDVAGAAVKAGMSYTDDASGQAIKSVASKSGKVYTQPQQIYDDVVAGNLKSSEGARLAKDMFQGGGNVIDDAAGSTPAQKWMADIANVNKGGGTTIANTAKTTSGAAKTASAASSTADDFASGAAKTTSSSTSSGAAKTAAGNTSGTSTGAKSTFKQKASDFYQNTKTKFNNSKAGQYYQNTKTKFTNSKFGQSVKNSADAATNRFNNIKSTVSGWGSSVKTGAQNFGNSVKTGATNMYNSAKTGVTNGYNYVKDLNAANPTYAGKWAAGAAGVNIVNIGTDDTATYDPNVYSNQTQNQSSSNNQTP